MRDDGGRAPGPGRLRIGNRQDFWSGVMFALAGIAFAWGATAYEIGTAAQMGPGYFPLLLGVLMTLLGMAVIVKSLVLQTAGGGMIGRWAWRPLVLVIGANLLFGVLIGGLPSIALPPLGLVLAIYTLTFVASLASEEFRFGEVFVLATVLAVMSYLGIVVLLKLQFPLWPSFVSG